MPDGGQDGRNECNAAALCPSAAPPCVACSRRPCCSVSVGGRARADARAAPRTRRSARAAPPRRDRSPTRRSSTASSRSPSAPNSTSPAGSTASASSTCPVRAYIDNRGRPDRSGEIGRVIADIGRHIDKLDIAVTDDQRIANVVITLVRDRDLDRTIAGLFGRERARRIETRSSRNACPASARTRPIGSRAPR